MLKIQREIIYIYLSENDVEEERVLGVGKLNSVLNYCSSSSISYGLATNVDSRDVGDLEPLSPFAFLAVLFQQRTITNIKFQKRGRQALLWEEFEFRADPDL